MNTVCAAVPSRQEDPFSDGHAGAVMDGWTLMTFDNVGNALACHVVSDALKVDAATQPFVLAHGEPAKAGAFPATTRTGSVHPTPLVSCLRGTAAGGVGVLSGIMAQSP